MSPALQLATFAKSGGLAARTGQFQPVADVGIYSAGKRVLPTIYYTTPASLAEIIMDDIVTGQPLQFSFAMAIYYPARYSGVNAPLVHGIQARRRPLLQQQ